MRTANNTNNYTVEGLVAKYRNFVNENAPRESVPHEWQDKNGEWHSDDCYVIMDSHAYAEEQLLASLYKDVLGDRADSKVLQALSKQLKLFKREAFTDSEYTYLCEHFSDVSTFLYDHRDKWLGAEASSPKSLPKSTEYVHKMSMFKKGQTVFIADSSSCDVAAIFSGCRVQGFTGLHGLHSDEVWALGQIRLFAAGIESDIVSGTFDKSDNYSYPLPSKGSVDIVIFGTMWCTDCNDIEALYNLLKEGGRMLMFFSRYDLFSPKANYKAFLHKLVDEKAISSIISFEEEESLLGVVDQKILICAEKKKHSTTHIESTIRSITAIVDTLTLDAEMLWPGYYLTNRPKQGCPLSSLTTLFTTKDELRRQYRLRKNRNGSLLDDPYLGFDSNLMVLAPDFLGESYSKSNLDAKKLLPLSDAKFEDLRGRMLELKEPGICVNGNTERLLVGYITQNPCNYVCIVSIPYLIPKKGIDVRYIAALLLSSEVKQQVISICDGSVSSLSFSMVLDRIIVPKHTPKERIQFLAEANYEALLSTQQEMKKNHEDYKKAVRMRKHALTQSLSSIEDMFDVLNYYREQHDGNLSDNEMVSTDPDISVKGAFEYLSSNIKELMPVMEHIADVDYSFKSPEWIDPDAFIENYISNNQNGWSNFKPVVTWREEHNKHSVDIIDPITGEVAARKGETIYCLSFPSDALTLVFNNIIANARAHAFTDETRKDYLLRFSWKADGLGLKLEIANNGTPIPADRDTASLFEYGVSSKLHQDGHNGIGCNVIDDIMRRFDGKVEIVSSPEDEFTVKYILTFKSNILYIL